MSTRCRQIIAHTAKRLALSTLLIAAVSAPSRAQPQSADSTGPRIVYACFLRSSGTVYRIKERGLPSACKGTTAVEFSWLEGVTTAAGAAGPVPPVPSPASSLRLRVRRGSSRRPGIRVCRRRSSIAVRGCGRGLASGETSCGSCTAPEGSRTPHKHNRCPPRRRASASGP